jgi:hypothetical protein
MNLYMDGEPDSELFEGEGTDTAKEHQDDEVDSGLREGDGDDTSDEDGLEMILGCRSTPSLPLKGSESSSKREPLDVPRTWLTTDEEGGTPNEVIEESTWFKGNSDSGLVTIWNSFRSKPSTSKPFDSDANTVYEYPKSESSKTFKDRGPPSSHLDDGPTLKETPKSPPAKSTTSKQRLIVLSEWKPYISSNPNPFQKSSRPTVVLPSSQRSEIKKAPEVRGPIGCPMAETLINPHRAVERQQDPNSYSSFLKAHVLNETVEGPPPNYSRPLRPKRTSSEPNHNTRLAFRKESSYSDLGYIIPPDIQTLMFRVERDAACIPFMPSTYDPTRTPHVNLTRALRTKDLKVIWRECGENLDVASTFALNSKKWKVSNERWREVERLKQETEIVGEELEGEKLEGGTLEE